MKHFRQKGVPFPKPAQFQRFLWPHDSVDFAISLFCQEGFQSAAKPDCSSARKWSSSFWLGPLKCDITTEWIQEDPQVTFRREEKLCLKQSSRVNLDRRTRIWAQNCGVLHQESSQNGINSGQFKLVLYTNSPPMIPMMCVSFAVT